MAVSRLLPLGLGGGGAAAHSLGDALGQHLTLEGVLVLETLHLLLYLWPILLLCGVCGFGGQLEAVGGSRVGRAQSPGL